MFTIKNLIILLLSIFVFGCSSVDDLFDGVEPRPVGVTIKNVEETEKFVSFDAFFFCNLNTEKMTVHTKYMLNDSPKIYDGPVKSYYFPKEMRKKGKQNIGVGFNFLVKKDMYSIDFIIDTFRGKPNKNRVVWKKKQTGRKSFTLNEILNNSSYR